MSQEAAVTEQVQLCDIHAGKTQAAALGGEEEVAQPASDFHSPTRRRPL
jgi:hypothetical protein